MYNSHMCNIDFLWTKMGKQVERNKKCWMEENNDYNLDKMVKLTKTSTKKSEKILEKYWFCHINFVLD